MVQQHLTRLSRLSWIVLIISLVLTVFSSLQAKRASEQSASKDFAFTSSQVSIKIEERLDTFALVLRGGTGLFDTFGDVSREDWEKYVSKLQVSNVIRGVSGVNFAKLLAPEDLAEHIDSVRAQGLPNYHVWPEYPRDTYTSLLYLSPFSEQNQRALGYDMFSESTRRQAMIQARDTGLASLSGKIELMIEDGEKPQAGTLMFMPIYQPNAELDTVAQRRAALIGWALSAYRMDDLLQGILGDWQAQLQKMVNLRIYDGDTATREHLLYQNHPHASSTPSLFYHQNIIDFNGHQWLLTFDYLQPNNIIDYSNAWSMLLGGLILSSLLFFLIRSILNTRVRAFNLAKQLTEQIQQRELQVKALLLRLQTITSRIPGMVFEYRLYPDGHGAFSYASDGIIDIYGVTPQQVQVDASIVFTAIHPDDVPDVRRISQESAANLTPWRHEYRVRLQDGIQQWVFGDSQPHREEDGSVSWYGVITNITERKQSELALKAANQQTQRFRQALDQVSSCIFMKDSELRFTYANSATLALVGCTPNMLLGSKGHEFFNAETAELLRQADIKVLSGEQVQTEFSISSRDGKFITFLDVKTPIYDEDESQDVVGLLGIATDITSLKAHEEKLEHMAHYDHLTKLPNRLMLADRLHQAMLQAQRHQQVLAVVYLDLDGFKQINDTYGHTAGDHLLVTIATRMKVAIREGDTLSRLGGDEFVAILLDLNHVDDSIPLLNRLLLAASRPIQLGRHRLQVSASLGVSFYPQAENLEAEQLIRQADQAMYQAKQAGKNRYSLFDTEQARTIRNYHESVEHIKEAMLDEQFVLYYQPKVNMRTGKVIGVEALIRWQHPEKGLLAPIHFLPTIEEHKLSEELGHWVIETALQQIYIWQQQGIHLPTSVNISARHLRMPSFSLRLRQLLQKYPAISPKMLELEVLETSTLGDLAQISQTLEECRALGVELSLDDFGTGYSSLTYLKRLPANIIKVDQSFIRDILEDPEDLAILDGVLGLAKAFGRNVIAEGVETIAHGDTLLRMGCELAQGYGIARPMSAEHIPDWILNWQPAAHWKQIQKLTREQLPLLYAGIELNTWINELILTLDNTSEGWPLLNISQGHLAQWLNSQPDIEPACLARQTELYQQIEQQINILQRQHQAGSSPDISQEKDALSTLRDQLLNQLQACMQT